MYNCNYNIDSLNSGINQRPKVNLEKLIRIIFFTAGISLVLFFPISCKKMVLIDPPVDTIVTDQVFDNEATANSAVIGIYNSFHTSNSVLSLENRLTLYAGLSSDELLYFNASDLATNQFQTNTLDQNNSIVKDFWTPVYSTIYRCNAAIEGLEKSNVLKIELKNQLLGEAKFLRAFCYFYLTNLFGNVPLVLSTNWSSTMSISPTEQKDVYQQIISDLKDAQNILTSDYSISSGQRIRANKFAAIALLSRVYLYVNDWSKAEDNASQVINQTSLYSLQTDLTKVFLASNSSYVNTEAIFQFQVYDLSPFSNVEAFRIIPATRTSAPTWYLSNQLLAAFEANDKRRKIWIDSTKYKVNNVTTTYYFPYKYKVRTASVTSEFHNILRLAELFLIRAEARARLGKNTDAVSDLNVIRERAGLNDVSTTLQQSELLQAIYKERKVELFSERGDRWFDLKRTEQANSILGQIKPGWNENRLLYPIPFSEIQIAPNLIQNKGY